MVSVATWSDCSRAGPVPPLVILGMGIAERLTHDANAQHAELSEVAHLPVPVAGTPQSLI